MAESRFLFMIATYNAAPWLHRLVPSLASQTWPNWNVVFADDASSDDTMDRLNTQLEEHGVRERFALVCNDNRKYKARNVFDCLAVHGQNEDIVVMLDGDDWLADNRALEMLAEEYANGWEVVWSNWVGSDGSPGRSAHLNPFISPRHQPWVTSHLFTFRKYLFNKVCQEDLQDEAGQWFRAGCDVAIAIPILEQTIRCRFLDEVLCVYNRDNNLSHDRQGDGRYTSSAQMAATQTLMKRSVREPPEDNEFLAANLQYFLTAAFRNADRSGRMRLDRTLRALFSQVESTESRSPAVPPWRRKGSQGGAP